jgi:hypothetical protein
MCKFCTIKRGKTTGEKIYGRSYAPKLYIEKKFDSYYLVASGDNDNKLKISYCPICGSKLD